MIPEQTKNQILAASKIEDTIRDFHDLKKTGSSFYTKCPKCDQEGKGKGLIVTPAKKIYKCFNCEFSGKTSVSFLMETQNMNYPEALKYLADRYNIAIVEEKAPRGPQKKSGKKIKSFRDKQLEESGLTVKDQKATVYIDENTTEIRDVFLPGTRDQYGKIVSGDDMIIWFYDLDGKEVMYQKPKKDKLERLYRIRWQNPSIHLDKHGRPMKYSSPYGSGTHLYIPELIREKYQSGRIIKRLFLQEGEKKAEKACKHGIPSVGIMGIHNIAYSGKLPYEFQLIVNKCKVEEIILVLDNDWDHLSENIKPGDKVDQRPWSFFHAVKNFRDYFKTFINQGVYLELYFIYIKDNKNNDKGIDDLLTNTLKHKKDLLGDTELLDDIKKAINEKDGDAKYVQLHKISTLSDLKLMELWSLQSAEIFAEKHIDTLRNIPEFKIGKLKWRIDNDDKLVLAQPLQNDEIYWHEIVSQDSAGNETVKYHFDYENSYNFLRNRGFGRIMMEDGKYNFCRIEDRVVTIKEQYEIKDFVMQFTKEVAPKDVRNMLYRGGHYFFGPHSIGNIDFVEPRFEIAAKNFQYLFFKDKFWKITAEDIIEKPISELEHYVWSENINDFEAKLLKDELIKIEEIDKKENPGEYGFELTEQGKKCHYLRFLINSSNFFWEKDHDDLILAEHLETTMHIINKLTAKGYLLHKHFNESKAKQVIGMDGKMSEVGASNGGTGKSIFGDAIGNIIPQVAIGGKYKKITEDPFIFENVSAKTDNVFIDDVRANFDHEFLFPFITGKFSVNGKGDKKFTIKKEDTPKIYTTTNHAPYNQDTSFKRRQFFIAFSDFYNDKHVPIDDFGTNFFSEWNNQQQNLWLNLAARCIQLYFKLGLVPCPRERLEARRLRQHIGEDMLGWADEYFGYNELKESFEDEETINTKHARKDLFDNLISKNKKLLRYLTQTTFKKKFKSYCEYRQTTFNPHKLDQGGNPGQNDKTGGVEYFTIGDENYKGEF